MSTTRENRARELATQVLWRAVGTLAAVAIVFVCWRELGELEKKERRRW